MKKTILLFVVLAFFVTKSDSQTVIDYDGNVYDTAKIGTQVWLKENLKVTHYLNGDPIPNITDNTVWSKQSAGAYCNINNDTNYVKTYGRIYNWYAVNDNRKLAPKGWHIPTDTEWQILVDYLGSSTIAGGKMKEAGNSHWNSPNTGADNSSGFTALPSGCRTGSGNYYDFGKMAYWWSVTSYSTDQAWYRSLKYYNSSIVRSNFMMKMVGISIRCLKDTPSQINENNYQENIDIYPNPVTDKLYLNNSTRQTLKMQIYNTVGQCVLQKELNTQTSEINISSLTKGIYILKLTSPYGTIEKKIIKE
jgi:uncharacterized protein (TIGR02145 family)